MPTTNGNTRNHPLAPRRRRTTGFLIVLVILWAIKPEFVEAFSMWISITGAIVSLPAFREETTRVPHSEGTEQKGMPFREKLVTLMRQSAMFCLTRANWWNGVIRFRRRIA